MISSDPVQKLGEKVIFDLVYFSFENSVLMFFASRGNKVELGGMPGIEYLAHVANYLYRVVVEWGV